MTVWPKGQNQVTWLQCVQQYMYGHVDSYFVHNVTLCFECHAAQQYVVLTSYHKSHVRISITSMSVYLRLAENALIWEYLGDWVNH